MYTIATSREVLLGTFTLKKLKNYIPVLIGILNVKVIFDVPWATHRWICETLAGKHIKTMLYSGYIKFLNNISVTSDKANLKALLKFVKNDVRSQTGGNI